MSKYELVRKSTTELGRFKVTIVADSNDADYITTINTYSKETFDKHIVDELIDLQNNYGESHQLRNFEEGWLDIPCGDIDRCHSLKSVNVEHIDDKGIAWDVIFLDCEFK
ncbi:hypothetical protein ABEO76_21505 [Bacillus anthracis]|uniref:hypothetical protein n=1 Tax=Bacillus anthracis TaxID=1392 RepID=UPI003D239300